MEKSPAWGMPRGELACHNRAMNTFRPYLAWYQTKESPNTWSFGVWDGAGVSSVRAFVVKTEANIWIWQSKEEKSGKIIIRKGEAADFDSARTQAERSLTVS